MKPEVGKLFLEPTANEPLQLTVPQENPSKTLEMLKPPELLLPLLSQLQRNWHTPRTDLIFPLS